MDITTVVIPIAGLGTRLLPVSLLVAKEFLPLGKKPAIQLIAEEVAAAGISKIVFVVSPEKHHVTDLFTDNKDRLPRLEGEKKSLLDTIWSTSKFAGVEIETCVQDRQLGLGHAVLCAEKLVGDQPFAVALGDCLIGIPGRSNSFAKLLKSFGNERAGISVLFEAVPIEKVSRYGIAKCGGQMDPKADIFELEGIMEKPDRKNAPSRMAVCGRYVFTSQIFECLKRIQPGKNGELQLTDAIDVLIKQGVKAIGRRIPENEKRYDVGDIRSYVQSFVEIALADPDLAPFVNEAVARNKRAASS